jgi:hypothetical protein
MFPQQVRLGNSPGEALDVSIHLAIFKYRLRQGADITDEGQEI